MSYRIIHAIIYLFSLLPLWWHYIWAYFMYLITYYIVGYRKETVRKNIANSFPELTEKERHVIVKKFYRSFCNHFDEIVKLVSISHRGIETHIDIRGIDNLEKYYNEKRHVIHALGRWCPL